MKKTNETAATLTAKINDAIARNLTPAYVNRLRKQLERLTATTDTPAPVCDTPAPVCDTPATDTPTAAPVRHDVTTWNERPSTATATPDAAGVAHLNATANKLNREFNSYDGFARAMKNEADLFGVGGYYFREIAIAHGALFVERPARQSGETDAAYINRVNKHADAVARARFDRTDPDTLRASALYRVFCSKNKLFGFLRLNVCRYVETVDKDGRNVTHTVFATPSVLIRAKKNLTRGQVVDATDKKHETREIGGVEYIAPVTAWKRYDAIAHMRRMQARADLLPLTETAAVWKDAKDNICTLTPSDRCTFRQLLPVLSRVAVTVRVKVAATPARDGGELTTPDTLNVYTNADNTPDNLNAPVSADAQIIPAPVCDTPATDTTAPARVSLRTATRRNVATATA